MNSVNRFWIIVFFVFFGLQHMYALNVNVTTYGAIGNDVTDDRLAIQNAIDAVNASGGGKMHPIVSTN